MHPHNRYYSHVREPFMQTSVKISKGIKSVRWYNQTYNGGTDEKIIYIVMHPRGCTLFRL